METFLALWPALQPIVTPVLAGLVTQLLKSMINNDRIRPYLPILAGTVGSVIGAVMHTPDAQTLATGFTSGAVGGLAATGGHQVLKQLKQKEDEPLQQKGDV